MDGRIFDGASGPGQGGGGKDFREISPFFSFSLADMAVMSRLSSPSPTTMLPLKMLVKPKIECSTVDLPAPLGPIRHRDCFFDTCRLKLCRISILPYPARRFSIFT